MKKLHLNSLLLILSLFFIECGINKKVELLKYKYYFSDDIYDYNEDIELGHAYYHAFNFAKNDGEWQVIPLKNYNNATYYLSQDKKTWVDSLNYYAGLSLDTSRCKFYFKKDTLFIKSFSPYSIEMELERKFYIKYQSDSLNVNYIFPDNDLLSYKTLYCGDAIVRINNIKFICEKIKVFTVTPTALLYNQSKMQPSKEKELYYKIYYFEKSTHIPIIIQQCSNNSYIKAFIYPRNKTYPLVKNIKGCNCK